MVLEAEVGERLGITAPGTRERLASVLDALLGAVRDTPRLDVESAVPYLRADKKVRAGRSRVVLLRRVGEVDPGDGWSHEVAENVLVEALTTGARVS
jgi:3-dehydroquinate synthetase